MVDVPSRNHCYECPESRNATRYQSGTRDLQLFPRQRDARELSMVSGADEIDAVRRYLDEAFLCTLASVRFIIPFRSGGRPAA